VRCQPRLGHLFFSLARDPLSGRQVRLVVEEESDSDVDAEIFEVNRAHGLGNVLKIRSCRAESYRTSFVFLILGSGVFGYTA